MSEIIQVIAGVITVGGMAVRVLAYNTGLTSVSTFGVGAAAIGLLSVGATLAADAPKYGTMIALEQRRFVKLFALIPATSLATALAARSIPPLVAAPWIFSSAASLLCAIVARVRGSPNWGTVSVGFHSISIMVVAAAMGLTM